MMLFIIRDENWSGFDKVVVKSDIVAFDAVDKLLVIATSENELELWIDSTRRGSISSRGKIAALSILANSVSDSAGLREMFVAVGSQHGELILVKWIWRD